MPATLIATTRAGEVQALGAAGQRTTDIWSALHQLLRQRLTPEHAALLAEPVVNAAQGETDWYAEVAGAVVPLLSLPPDAQAAARARLGELSGDIVALAGALEAERSEGDRFLGAMLRLAMQVPGEAQVFVAGAQPILAAWGHARAGAGGGGVVLGGDRAAARAASGARRAMLILPPPTAPVTAARRYGPVLAAALAVALLCLASSVYAVARDPFGWYAVNEPGCQPPGDDMALRTALQGAADRESELRLQLAQLSTDAGGRRLMCPPVQPAALPVAPPPPPPQRSADQNRAQDRGAKHGKLTLILAWDDRNDLDLQVRCPGGGTIFFAQRSACGGTLDVDANGDARVADAQPVENVFFTDPRPGTYQVIVDPYAMRVNRATPFRLTVQQEGLPDRVVTGTAEAGRRVQEVTTVTVGSGP